MGVLSRHHVPILTVLTLTHDGHIVLCDAPAPVIPVIAIGLARLR
jgi:hypothetical protein